MKQDEAPESIIAHPWNSLIWVVLFFVGVERLGDAVKYILRGDTLFTEKISKSPFDFSSETLLPVALRGPLFPTLHRQR
jgi:hypothetical protein